MYLIVNIKTDDLEGNYAKAQKNLDAMEALVRQPVAPPAFTPARLGEITSNQDRKTYGENVEKSRNTSARATFSRRCIPSGSLLPMTRICSTCTGSSGPPILPSTWCC